MSQFIVSARKYRPGRFDEVVGQDHVTRTLKNAIRQNKVAHAFLFCGPRGVGKTTTARILAKTINCENITEDFEACGECLSCRSFDKKNAPNIIELDAASNNSVDYIRTLNEQVRIPPAQGKYKLFIIDEVHMLSTSAFNAFLKTLEEPPPFAVFILATTEKHKIIPTILSRCQIYDFKRNQVRDILPHLEKICKSEEITYDKEALHLIAEKADGALRDALSIFDRIVSFSDGHITYEAVIDQLNILDHDYYFQLMDHIITGNMAEVYLLFNDILEKGFDAEVFLLGFQEHLRQLLMVHLGKTAILTEASEQLNNRYNSQARNADRDMILTLLDLANECDVSYRFAQNKRLHVEIALMKMVYAPYAITLKKDTAREPEPSDRSKKKVKHDSSVIPEKRAQTDDAGKQEITTPQQLPKEEEPTDKSNPASSPDDSMVAEPEPEDPSSEPTLPTGNKKRRKKMLLPSLDNMEDLKIEVEQKTGSTKEIKDKDELFKSISKIWDHFTETHPSPSLVTYMKDAKLRWEEDTIHITVTSQLARSSILDQRVLFEQWREATAPYSPEIIFEIEPSDPSAIEAPAPLTTKDKYEALKKSNPHLDDLIEALHLKVDNV